MKIEASHVMCETIQAAQMKIWINSGLDWIDSERVKEFNDTTQGWLIRFKYESIHIHHDSIDIKSET